MACLAGRGRRQLDHGVGRAELRQPRLGVPGRKQRQREHGHDMNEAGKHEPEHDIEPGDPYSHDLRSILGRRSLGIEADARAVGVARAVDAQHQHEVAVGVVAARQPVLGARIARQVDAKSAVGVAKQSPRC